MSARKTEKVVLTEIDIEEVKLIADKLGEESAAAQALKHADETDGEVCFLAGRGKYQYTIAVKRVDND